MALLSLVISFFCWFEQRKYLMQSDLLFLCCMYGCQTTGWPKKTGPACFIANILKTPRPNYVEILRVLACLFTHYRLVWWRHTWRHSLFIFGLTLPERLCVTCSVTMLLSLRCVATKQSGLKSGGLRCLGGTSTIGLPILKLHVCRRTEAGNL